MKKLALIAVLVTMIGAFPAHAVTYGTLDGDAHPYVGLIRFWDSSGDKWRCSGTLLTSTVVLTAGHCTAGATTARVWFDSEAVPETGGVVGTPYTHPGFTSVSLATPDVGVVVLAKAVRMSTYGALPKEGTVVAILAEQGTNTTPHAVAGYGIQEVKPSYTALLTRYKGTVRIQNAGNSLGDYVQISSNSTAQWSGGTCAGDSGGPLFQLDTNIVLATTAGGANVNCKGASYDYRLDVASARSFLANYVTVP
jgi:secreted trypsin-like serine protease